MSVMNRLRELLPPPLTVERDSVLMQLLNVASLEFEALQEDLERVRQTHWIRTVFRLEEAEKLGALVDIPRLPGEGLSLYRERLIAMAAARLQGSTGPEEIRRFVYEFLSAAERAVDSTFVLGLQETVFEKAYRASQERPAFRPLSFRENPRRERLSSVLAARRFRVPYLFRWTESNRGLDETAAQFDLRGLFDGRTAVPVLANLTSGDVIGFRDVVRFGQRLRIVPAPDPGEQGRAAQALLDGNEVSDRLFSIEGFRLGVPFLPQDIDQTPRLPRMQRGPNDWIFLSVAHFDVDGLNRTFLAIADEDLREGVFGETGFDQSVFPSGPVAWVSMRWDEVEPASFRVGVPRTVAVESGDRPDGPVLELIEQGLRHSLDRLRAAGVRADLHFQPFVEVQPQKERFELPFRLLEPERGPTGIERDMTLGGRFGETRLGDSRFE